MSERDVKPENLTQEQRQRARNREERRQYARAARRRWRAVSVPFKAPNCTCLRCRNGCE